MCLVRKQFMYGQLSVTIIVFLLSVSTVHHVVGLVEIDVCK